MDVESSRTPTTGQSNPVAKAAAGPSSGGEPAVPTAKVSEVEGSEPQAIATPPIATPGAQLGGHSTGEAQAVSAVARMALDATKERIDAMKDTYDRLFAMIATLGALLAFLGFKGFESFVRAKESASDAVIEAEDAVDLAKGAVAKQEQFLDVDYPKNTSAEINVAHGLIMREIAEVYDAVGKQLRTEAGEAFTFPERRARLKDSLMYLERALKNENNLDIKVKCRALGTVGNVKKRLNDTLGALGAAKRVVEHDATDPSAHYNVACYASLAAEQEAGRCSSDDEASHVQEYVQLAFESLREAGKLHQRFLAQAKEEHDLRWLRAHNIHGTTFSTIVLVGDSRPDPQPIRRDVPQN
ncbi:hypothetical protein IB257_30315 [Achromobacter sp. ACM03]|uniref:hypothetical protein n=1 Tax=Achromobacter sp. ACM03 TaxID=2769300 RepID=UPI00178730BF|nr:hypothetical protein [Achromobacter sp. ACM03]MBD9434252.1 hypothetical protein [Achromobacter sp. ACM03]